MATASAQGLSRVEGSHGEGQSRGAVCSSLTVYGCDNFGYGSLLSVMSRECNQDEDRDGIGLPRKEQKGESTQQGQPSRVGLKSNTFVEKGSCVC